MTREIVARHINRKVVMNHQQNNRSKNVHLVWKGYAERQKDYKYTYPPSDRLFFIHSQYDLEKRVLVSQQSKITIEKYVRETYENGNDGNKKM